jgi:hypothetical protein
MKVLKESLKYISISIFFGLFLLVGDIYLNGTIEVTRNNQNYVNHIISANRENLLTSKTMQEIELIYNNILYEFQNELTYENYDIDILSSHPKLVLLKNTKNSMFYGKFVIKDFSYENPVVKFLSNIGDFNKRIFKNLNGAIVLTIPEVNNLKASEFLEFKKIIHNLIVHELTHFVMFKIAKYKNLNVNVMLSEYAPALMQYKFGKEIDFKNSYFKKVAKNIDIKSYYFALKKDRIKYTNPLEYSIVTYAANELFNSEENLAMFEDKPFKYLESKMLKNSKLIAKINNKIVLMNKC